MHSDMYESIWFKISLKINTIELHILMLVHVILTLIQGHRNATTKVLP